MEDSVESQKISEAIKLSNSLKQNKVDQQNNNKTPIQKRE